MTGPTQKQRFVEQDVIRDIQDAMRQNYGFMTMQPEMEILVQLFTGQQPNVNTLWNTQRYGFVCRCGFYQGVWNNLFKQTNNNYLDRSIV